MDDRGNLETYSRTMREPAWANSGDTWQWTKQLADFPATDGWTLTYYLNAGGAPLTFDAAVDADGTSYDVTVPAATTAAFAPGSYAWTAVVHQGAGGGAQRFTVDEGRIRICTNPSGTGALSHARKVLAAVEAVIEGRATKDQEEYQIGGRSLRRTPLPELTKFRRDYIAEVRREIYAEQLARGQGQHAGNMVKMRMRGFI